jgi:hypothetical protein
LQSERGARQQSEAKASASRDAEIVLRHYGDRNTLEHQRDAILNLARTDQVAYNREGKQHFNELMRIERALEQSSNTAERDFTTKYESDGSDADLTDQGQGINGGGDYDDNSNLEGE